MALPGALAVALGMASRMAAKLAGSLEKGLWNCDFTIVILELQV
jgi:hypothetical protein